MRSRSNQPGTGQLRDAALRRLSRVNGLLVAASIALTGLFAEAAARTFRGGSTARAEAARHAKSSSRHHHPHAASPTPLQPPAQAPEVAPAPSSESAPATAAPQAPAETSSPQASEAPAQREAPAPAAEPPPTEQSEPEPPTVSGGS